MGAAIVVLDHPDELGVFAPAPQLATMEQAHAAIGDAFALLDGPMFGAACSPHGRGPGCLQYRLLDRSRAVDSPSLYPTRGLTFAVGGIVSKARVLHGAPENELESARVAIQTYPSIVEEGDPGGPDEREGVGRAALCLMRDGRLAFAAGTGPLRVFARELAARGVAWAGYTDGGGSTGLLGPRDRVGGNRPIPAWIFARRRPWIARWWPVVLGAGAIVVASAVVAPRESK